MKDEIKNERFSLSFFPKFLFFLFLKLFSKKNCMIFVIINLFYELEFYMIMFIKELAYSIGFTLGCGCNERERGERKKNCKKFAVCKMIY